MFTQSSACPFHHKLNVVCKSWKNMERPPLLWRWVIRCVWCWGLQIRVVKAFQQGLDRREPMALGPSAARLREISRQLHAQHHAAPSAAASAAPPSGPTPAV